MAASNLPLQIELGTTASASATTSKKAPWAGSTNTRLITLTLDANGQALTLFPVVRIDLSWTQALARLHVHWLNL